MKKQSVLLEYVLKNKKSYLLILGLFLIGMILGIMFINHASEAQIVEIREYVSDLVKNIKSYDNINKTDLLSQSLAQNALSIILIWFLGCTIIGSVLVFVTIVYRGFSLGYTISAIIACLGIKKGCIFVVLGLLLQNIFFLPAFFILCESGIKLYNGLRKHCINLKLEVFRHTIVMLISMILILIASLVEVYVSTSFLIFLKEFL